MAIINIPAPLRPMAGGANRAEVAGATLREVISGLEAMYPGIQARLVEGERVRPGLAVFIDGAQAAPQLSTRVGPDAEIYFAPAIAGGLSQSSTTDVLEGKLAAETEVRISWLIGTFVRIDGV